MSGERLEAETEGPEQTMALAAALAQVARPNDVFGLQGSLGAGKTCFAKGFARGLGLDENRVKSPTFVLMRVYEGRLTLYHFDAYRLRNATEMHAIGCDETFAAGGVSLIEWADHVAECLPPTHFVLSFQVTGPTDRHITFKATGGAGQQRRPEIRHAMAPWAV